MSQTRAIAGLLACLSLPVVPSIGWAATTQTTYVINLHSGPGVDYQVVAVIPSGAFIDIFKCGAEWCYLTWGSHKGYAQGIHLIQHVTAQVPPLSDLKLDPADQNGNVAEARTKDCAAKWGMADLNGDGVLDRNEIAHYNTTIRITGQSVLADDAQLDKMGFVAECAAVSARE